MDPKVPLVGWIGRLDFQKGPDVILQSIGPMAQRGCQVSLGHKLFGGGGGWGRSWGEKGIAIVVQKGWGGIEVQEEGQTHWTHTETVVCISCDTISVLRAAVSSVWLCTITVSYTCCVHHAACAQRSYQVCILKHMHRRTGYVVRSLPRICPNRLVCTQ